MGGVQILLIEDDPAVARSVQDGLARDGYQVTWKNNGGQGVRYARENEFHLAVLDVRLPDGSGFDFCRQMRQSGLKQPVLMLTVRRDETDKILGLEAGADDYMTKPFSLRELVARVRALMRRAYGELANSDSELIHVADLVIDRSRGQVRRGTQLVNLTPIEFRLLTLLARHRGQVLSRAQILNAVWGYEADADSERIVNVHVRRLREKVEYNASEPALILTVPGVGYRLANA